MGSVLSIMFGILMLVTNIEDTEPVAMIISLLFIGVGALNLFGRYSAHKNQVQSQNTKVERGKEIIETLGGTENIDIDLSKYSNEVQLIVLKDKRVCVGRNNYTDKKTIDFESIIKIEMVIDNIKEQVEKIASIRDKKYSQEIIRSIKVYIHTNDSTEELVYLYQDFMTQQAQIYFNEIIKGIKRFEVIIDGFTNKNSVENELSIVKESSSIDQIKELKELLDLDAITHDEFEKKKAELLSKI